MQIMAANKKYPAAAAGGFAANVVTFDGNDVFDTALGMGASDNKLMTCAFWYDSTVDSTNQLIMCSSTNGVAGNYRMFIQKPDNQTMSFIYRDSGATIRLNVAGGSFTAAGGWSWVGVSVNLASTSQRHFYSGDTDVSPSWNTYSNAAVDHSVNQWRIGDWWAGGQRLTANIAEFYFTNEYIDFSVESNRRKFIDASGCPVDLGSDGSTPTGTAPLIYMKGNASTWNAGTGNNSGSGNDFPTVTGAVTDGTAIC